MAKNKVQFQKGYSLTDLFKDYGSEEKCEKALFQWKWPQGFHCPQCESTKYCALKARKLFQCNHCHHQTSLTSNTIFACTKLPLQTWFLAIHLITQSKTGLSALNLKRQIGVFYNNAWKVKQKIMQVMKERDDSQPLSGIVQLDDVYWAADHLSSNSTVVSDGLACFRSVEKSHCTHVRIVTGGGPNCVELEDFHWVNTMIANVKVSLHGAYHSVSAKHLPRYLSEFCYRFNRRFDLSQMLARFMSIAVRTAPMPYRLLKLAEPHG